MAMKHLHDPSASPLVELHIDELVLYGFAQRDRFRIAAAIERELSRLILRDHATGLPESSVSFERIDAGAFQLAANPQPQTVGIHAAQQIYRHLSLVQTRPASPQVEHRAETPR